MYVNYQQNNGINRFNVVEYAYNNNFNNVLKIGFFSMMFDFEIKFENVIQENFKIDVFVARERVELMMNVRRECEAFGKQARDGAKRDYNKKRTQIEFKMSDKNYLNAKNIISIKSFKKLNYKYNESYNIYELVDKMSYRLDFFFHYEKLL